MSFFTTTRLIFQQDIFQPSWRHKNVGYFFNWWKILNIIYSPVFLHHLKKSLQLLGLLRHYRDQVCSLVLLKKANKNIAVKYPFDGIKPLDWISSISDSLESYNIWPLWLYASPFILHMEAQGMFQNILLEEYHGTFHDTP